MPGLEIEVLVAQDPSADGEGGLAPELAADHLAEPPGVVPLPGLNAGVPGGVLRF
jgi:hypothetical protein